MSHGPLICRDCFTETDITTMSERTDANVKAVLECPNCGSKTFGI